MVVMKMSGPRGSRRLQITHNSQVPKQLVRFTAPVSLKFSYREVFLGLGKTAPVSPPLSESKVCIGPAGHYPLLGARLFASRQFIVDYGNFT